MRKRKSPIVLVTALVVVVAGVAGFNFATSRPGGNPADRAPAPEIQDIKPVGQARAAATTDQIASGVKQAMSSVKGGPSAHSPDAEASPGGPGGGSIILNPAMAAKPEKPKPNPSSTSAQWYSKDSALGSGKG